MPLKSNVLHPFVSRLCREKSGAIAVVFAVLLPVFIGGLAIAIDLSRAWDLDTQLQDAADAAALGGATQLDGEPGARVRAIQAAADSVLRLQANFQSFATDGAGGDVVIDASVNCADGSACVNPDITFYEDIDVDPPIIALSDIVANYIQVAVQPRRVDYFFTALVGAVTEANPRALATAYLGNVFCAVSPIMICNPFDDGSNPEFTLAEGGNPGPSWIGRSVKLDEGGAGAAWEPGIFGLLSVEDPGASAINEAFANVNGSAICLGSFVETKTGQVTAIRQGMNTRFDIFSGPFGNEVTNPKYFSSKNPVKGLKKKAGAGQNDCADASWEKGANPYTAAGRPQFMVEDDIADVLAGTMPGGHLPMASQPELFGHPRDACMYDSTCPAMPYVSALDRFGDGIWDLPLYMLLNHPTSPTTSGIPMNDLKSFVIGSRGAGGPQIGLNVGAGQRMITREEVYRWEQSNMLAAGATLNTMPDEAGVYDGPPRNCSVPDPAFTGLDRRILFVLVVNCISPVHDCSSNKGCGVVKGKTRDVVQAPGDGALAMYLTEPMGFYDTNNDLVAEIVGPADSDLFTEVESKYFVELVHGPGE